jgi:hypothetical protein
MGLGVIHSETVCPAASKCWPRARTISRSVKIPVALHHQGRARSSLTHQSGRFSHGRCGLYGQQALGHDVTHGGHGRTLLARRAACRPAPPETSSSGNFQPGLLVEPYKE